MLDIKRREFIKLLGGAAAWPLAARGQQRSVPVLGYLDSLDPIASAPDLKLLRQALGEDGFIEGQNIRFEFRWAEGQIDQLPVLATDLVRRQVAMILTVGQTTALAAKAANTTIPILSIGGADPVRLGLAASLGRPGGNVTGVTFFRNLATKRLGLLRELLPPASTIGYLTHPSSADNSEMQGVARDVRQHVVFFSASTAAEIDKAFATMGEQHVRGLVIDASRFMQGQHDQLIALAARYSIPTCYFNRTFVEAGGLMSYSDNRLESWRQAARYIRLILDGEMPANLPIQQPTKFQFILNMKTAKTLGLTVPAIVTAIADEVIE